MNIWEKSSGITQKNKKASIKPRKKRKVSEKLKKIGDLDISAVCLDKEKILDQDRKVFSLDFKLARDSMLEEITERIKNLWS